MVYDLKEKAEQKANSRVSPVHLRGQPYNRATVLKTWKKKSQHQLLNSPCQKVFRFLEPQKRSQPMSSPEDEIKRRRNQSSIANLVLNRFSDRLMEKLVAILLMQKDIVMIPKVYQDRLFPANYGSISLLRNISKIVESVILTGVRNEIVEVELITEEQFGFKPDLSTEYQLLQIIEARWVRVHLYLSSNKLQGGKEISAARLSLLIYLRVS